MLQRTVKLIFLLVFISHTTLAQRSGLGLKFGPNISTIGGNTEDIVPKLGFQAGLFGMTKLASAFSMRPEMYLSHQGAKSVTDPKINFNYWYVNFPLLLRMNNQNRSFAVYIGPQVGTVIHARAINSTDNTKENVTARLNNIEFSVTIGFDFLLGKRWSAQLNYVYGLSDSSQGNQSYNRSFQSSLNYSLDK